MEEICEIANRAKIAGKKIVYTHGVFDVFHIGHLYLLDQAKNFGDILIVSLTADAYINKGPGIPAFKEEDRMNILAALEIIDYVLLNNDFFPLSIIESLKPDFYVKGEDSNLKPTDGLLKEKALIERLGGKIVFTQSLPIHSTQVRPKIKQN